jgi:hypothetical protein
MEIQKYKRCLFTRLTTAAILVGTLSVPVNAHASAPISSDSNKGDGFDALRTKASCNSINTADKVEMFANAWLRGVDDVQMTKCFHTLSPKEGAGAFERFLALGGSAAPFETKKAEIRSQAKPQSIQDLLEFVDQPKPTSRNGAAKIVAKMQSRQRNAFAPYQIPVQTLGWYNQVNFWADNYWQNNSCDGTPAEADWEYAFYFGEPTYDYQFRITAQTSPVLALLYYHGKVITRAPGNGDVIACLGNGNSYLPDWYVAQSLIMWR